MMTTPHGFGKTQGRKYTISGSVQGKPILITLTGYNVIEVLAEAKSMHPGLKVTAVFLEKER